MTTSRFPWMILAAALLAPAATAQDIATNRLTLSARLGFNISARFQGNASSLALPTNRRTTPHGDLYNYDDGYVLTDSSGNSGGQTWYWGYDNSAKYPAGQVSDGIAFPEPTILLSRSTPKANFAFPSMEEDPSPGMEIAYNRFLGQLKRVKFSLEIAANWQSLCLRDTTTFYGSATRVTDAYPFTPGTTPPTATPNAPYQGSYGDEGFLLGDTPVSSAASTVPGAFQVAGRRQYDADLWGFRLGPQVSFQILGRLDLLLSGGLGVGLLDSTASWSDTITVGGSAFPDTGHGTDFGVLWGGYVGANLSWNFNDHWSSTVGAQYQNLGTYEAEFGGRRVEVNLSRSIFLQLGVSYRF